MDSSAWIGFSILLVVLLLLGYVRKASLANSRKINKVFNKITHEKKLHISEKETWDNGIIGVDTKQRAVIIVCETREKFENTMLYINNISSCTVVHDRTPSYTRITMKFTYENAAQPPSDICFYDSSVDILSNMAELKQKAERMRDVIQELAQKNN